MEDQRKTPELGIVQGDRIVPVTTKRIPGKTLEKVLSHLQENDELFDYNVPQEMRDFSREGVQDFISRVYVQGNFEIVGAEHVARHIKQYDFVEFINSEPSSGYDYFLKPGMKGVIIRVNLDLDFPLRVRWEACDEYPTEKELNHNGNNLVLLPSGRFGRKKVTNQVEILSNASPGRLVEQTKESYEYSFYAPPGIKGIVTEIGSSGNRPVRVVFGNTEGYIPPKEGYLLCPYGSLKVIKENPFDFWGLVERYSEGDRSRL